MGKGYRARGTLVKCFLVEDSVFQLARLPFLGYHWTPDAEGIPKMKILVCVKQVSDSSDALQIDEDTDYLSYTANTAFRMNRFDEFALEEALLIKENLAGTLVDVLSVGPEQVRATVQRAMGMGADHGIHILDRAAGYRSPFTVASFITASISARNYDLILTGVMAEDTLASQTGQLIAALLDLPCATSVIQEEIHPERAEILVQREIEGGSRETVQIKMPAVLTIQPGINFPRYPSFSKVMRARTYVQEILRAEDLATEEPRELCCRVRVPEASCQGVIIEGSARDKAHKLVRILHEESLLC